MKLCECGCGKETKFRRGWPNRYLNGHRSSVQPRGDKSHAWKGGEITVKGRVLIHKPRHSRATSLGYVLRYHLIAEEATGNPIPKGVVIHHVDGTKNHDVNTNLVVCENDAYHQFLHQRKRAYVGCGHAAWRKCWICCEYDDPKNLYIRTYKPKGGCSYHRECRSIKQKAKYIIDKAASSRRLNADIKAM